MRRLFWDDPYLVSCTVVIENVRNGWICLDNTIVYSFSGGQQSDIAWIEGSPVSASQILDDKTILYQVKESTDFRPGQVVDVKIDWETRYRIMKLHSAIHMAMAAFFDVVGRVPVVGANVSAEKGRIDFSYGEPLTPLISQIEHIVSELVSQDLPIITKPDETSNDAYSRLWLIEGIGENWRISCGGTHPRRTSEIGRILIKRKNIGAGKERIEVVLA